MNDLLSKENLSSFIVLDIGGTSFRAALFNTDNALLRFPQKFPTPNFLKYPNISIKDLQELLMKKIIDVVKSYQAKHQYLKVVGLSFPAPITVDGIVKQASTVWGNKGLNYPLLEILSKKLPSIRWVIANDITAAAERYANMKKYRNIDYFAVITISSGIGSKIYDVKNRKVILDKRSIGGEIGHIKVDFSKSALVCDCGGKGHLYVLSSGRAMERMAISTALQFPESYGKSHLSKIVKDPKDINNQSIVEAIKMRDSFSLQIIEQATFHLACSISHISGNIGVDKFIIVGGFALNCGEPYLELLRKNLYKTDFYGREKDEIANIVEFGVNDDNDSLIGIGLLARKILVEK
ncbi:MAG: ROK family protein [Candidatus Scalindua sp.]